MDGNQQINSDHIEKNASWNICAKSFRTNRGFVQNLGFYRRRNITNNGNQTITTNNGNDSNTSSSNNSNGNDIPHKIESQEKFYWSFVAGSTFEKDLNTWYEKTVHWKKNLFMLPSGAAGKSMSKKLHVSWSYGHNTNLEVNITKSSTRYADNTYHLKYHLQGLERHIKLWN